MAYVILWKNFLFFLFFFPSISFIVYFFFLWKLFKNDGRKRWNIRIVRLPSVNILPFFFLPFFFCNFGMGNFKFWNASIEIKFIGFFFSKEKERERGRDWKKRHLKYFIPLTPFHLSLFYFLSFHQFNFPRSYFVYLFIYFYFYFFF